MHGATGKEEPRPMASIQTCDKTITFTSEANYVICMAWNSVAFTPLDIFPESTAYKGWPQRPIQLSSLTRKLSKQQT